MTIDAFKAVGGYDEVFSHVEDVELDDRLTAGGFHIYLTGEVQVTYYPRDSVIRLCRQYFNVGRGRARNLVKHRRNTKPRHLLLAAVAPALCLIVLTPLLRVLALPALAWAVLCLGYGIGLGARCKMHVRAAGVAAMVMQGAWSFGFFRELIAELSRRHAGRMS